ncbi:MAG: cytochrome family [Solirubrobacteraceae bacterium]|jgi:cytochrome P450|nr:cytochrome family [Solirubrobacteraceae bacterium]
MTRPPSPRHPSLIQTARYGLDPVNYLVGLHRKLGDVFHTKLLGEHYVWVAPPALNSEIFRRDEAGVSAGATRAPFMDFLVGEQSVLCLEGDAWQTERKRLAAPFHGRAVEHWRAEVNALAVEHVDRLPHDGPFAARDFTQAFALDVILKIVFGVTDTTRMQGALARLMRTPAAIAWPALRRAAQRVGVGPWNRFVADRAAFDAILAEEIARRRAAPGGEDLIATLLSGDVSDAQLRDDLATIIAAGHETTATALAWSLELLARHPGVVAELERDVAEHGDKGPYLEAVVRETLRVRPILTDAAREVTAPLELGGFDVPVGWHVCPGIAITQRLPEYWPEPAAFRPERFLVARPPYEAWLPFGGGRRRCLGSGFAQMEMRAYLAALIERRTLSAQSSKPERAMLRGFTVAPARGGRVSAPVRTRTAVRA